MNRKLWGTVFGMSLGLMIGAKLTPSNRKKMMKRTKKATSNMMDGIQNIWD